MKKLILNGADWWMFHQNVDKGEWKILHLYSNAMILDLWTDLYTLRTYGSGLGGWKELKEFPLPGVSGADRIRKEKREK